MLEHLEKKQEHIYHSAQATKKGKSVISGTNLKGLLLAFSLLAISSICFAQDIIVTKDSKKIKVKVTRIDLDKVIYKDFNDQGGASHTIQKKDVASILYEDGEVETFGQDTKAPAKVQATTTPVERQRPATDNYRSNYNSDSKPVVVSKAQETAPAEDIPKTRWGIKVGINSATIVLSNDNNSASMKSVVGAVAGVTLEQPFTPKWFFHSGLEASMKGFSTDQGELKSTAVYLLLPATIGYKINIGKGWKLEPRAGFYFAYGIGGSTKATVSGYSASVKTFGDKILKPFDVGFLGGVFFDNSRFVIGVHGEAGFINTNGDNLSVSDNIKNVRSSNVSFTIGYLF